MGAARAMYPVKTIVDFLLSGVSRIPRAERIDALCSMFAGLLPEMSEADIAIAREQVIARFWGDPDISDPVVDLIDGHVALRAIVNGSSVSASESRPPFG